MLAPALALGLVLAFESVYMAMLRYYGGAPSGSAMGLYSAAFALAIVCGVNADRRGRAAGRVYEFDAFVFFLWPFVLPVYLFQTRRWAGLALALGIFLSYQLPWLAALLMDRWLYASGSQRG